MNIELDQVTLSLMTAIVVIVSGVFFIVETLLRRDEGAGRVWSIGFLGAMLTTLSYMAWALDPTAMWPVAVGNTTFVAGTGCMWLGCRVFNRRRMTVSSIVVAVGAVGAFASVLLAGPQGGDWAGAPWMFVCLMVFAALGAVESVRGDMGTYRTSWGLCAVLALQALFYVGRLIVVGVEGFRGTLFLTWFGSATTSILTVVLTIVALVVTSVLRADRVAQRGTVPAAPAPLIGTEGVLSRAVFARLLAEATARAARRGDLIAVLAVRMDDLPQISTAFGSETARDIAQAARTSVQRNAAALSLVGEDGPNGLLLAVLASSEPDARRQGGLVYRGLLDDLGDVAGGVIPVVGIGIVLGGAGRTDAADLMDSARDAARRAAGTAGTSVLVGGATDLSAL